MPTLQELVDKRANVWSHMSEIMQRTDGTPTGEDAKAYAAAESEFDTLEETISRGVKYQKTKALMDAEEDRKRNGGAVERPANLVSGGGAQARDERQAEYDRVFRSFVADGAMDLTPEDRRVLASGLRTDDETSKAIRAAAGTGSTAGGYLIPPAFRDIVVQTMLYWGPMLQLAEIVETNSGANLPWPTNDDTANEGAILAENTQVTEQDVTLGTNSLDAFMYTSKLVRVSFQLLQDRPDFDTWLATRLGERLARIYNRHATVGTGTAQPDGIMTSATVGETGTGSFASTGGIAYDNLVNLVESLDQAYLLGPDGARFMGHQSVRKAVRKLKDTQNRPLWEPSLQAGTPDSMLGYPFEVNNHCATLAQNAKPLGFGNIREAYVIRLVRDNTLLRLSERYADFLQVGFLMFGRMDATLQNAGAFKTFQVTNTA